MEIALALSKPKLHTPGFCSFHNASLLDSMITIPPNTTLEEVLYQQKSSHGEIISSTLKAEKYM